MLKDKEIKVRVNVARRRIHNVIKQRANEIDSEYNIFILYCEVCLKVSFAVVLENRFGI